MAKRLSALESLLELRELMDSNEHVGLRERAGLPQIAIAQAAGVTKGCISRWEANQRRPTGRAALAYHKVLTRLAEAEAAQAARAAKASVSRAPAPANAPPRRPVRSELGAHCEVA